MTITLALPDQETSDRLRGRLGDRLDSAVDVVIWRAGDAPLDLPIDLLVLPYVVKYELLAGLTGEVRYVQSQALGYDGVTDHLPAGVSFCNAVGVHEAPTAELAITLTLASQRGWPQVGRNQVAESWDRFTYPGLIGARVLLIGVGGIGREVERRLAGYEVELTRVARSARDGIHAISELPALLPDADIVILAVPLSDETTGLVDGAFLDLLPHGALVVNVSRGRIIDTDALVEHVRSGAVRSALDVVDPEPLPAGHPLWSLPGSLISPHLGGSVQSMPSRIDPLIVRQVDRLIAGQKPDHIVIEGTK
ncbi:MAG TPA: 2-hydroxyacid dehydrogenase [Galbitalea sp.]|jgi:phosphoglycerate dehydrogenase-like enzyme